MTLLASERSLLIRSKFRSVLQLRIQNRRQNEINADSGLKSTCPSQKAEKEQSGALRLTDDAATQKSPPSGRKTETAQATDRSVCAAQRQKKARHTEQPSPRFQRRPGSLEPAHTHTPAPDHCPVVSSSFPLSSDVFEGDISSCSSSSSSAEHGGLLLPLRHQSPAFSSSSPPGPALLLPGDQLLSDLSPAGPPLHPHHPHHHHHSPQSHAQSALVLLPATEGTGQPTGMTLQGEATSTATTGRPGGMYVTSSSSPATPLLPKTARPPGSPSASAALIPSLASARPPRPRKPRETKPKMRKLKYHQYIPPDQRVSPATAVGGAIKKSPTAAQPIVDPAYSHLLQKQQVFLQLQILQNQQQHQQQQQQQHQQPTQQQQQQQQPTNAVPSGGEANQMARFSGAQPVGARTNHTPADEGTGTPKPELLPANLVDLTVSELRQQLRKRGLPVSGTKPALLQRLRPFQLPHTCLTPTPLCQLGEPLLPSPAAPTTHTQTPTAAAAPTVPSLLLLPPPLTPVMSHCSPSGSSQASSSAPDSPVSSPGQRLYIQPSGGIPNGVHHGGVPGVAVSVAGEQCSVFLAPPAGTPSGTPSPSLPLSSSSSPCSASSPLQQCGAPWRTDLEQQMELSLEEAMRERRRNRPRDRAFSTVTESCVGSLHPFLQQDPGRVRVKTEPVDEQTEVLFTQVFCCQPCDPIGQDFELPVQITASPVQTPPTPCSVRSLEEELQEAIQKAQMGPSQSLEDILDDWMPLPSYHVALLDAAAAHINDVPQQQSDQSQQPSSQQSDQSQRPSPQQSHQSQPSSSSQQSDQPQQQQPSLMQQQQQSDQSQPGGSALQQQPIGVGNNNNKDDRNFLSSPLCSSLLLEMPPSPVVVTSSAAAAAAPPPPPLQPLLPPPCASSPLSSPSSARGGGGGGGVGRKRRAAVAFFDPSEWLETLSCGLRPLSPAAPAACGAPFLDDLVESDLNVNRVLDMLIEQW